MKIVFFLKITLLLFISHNLKSQDFSNCNIKKSQEYTKNALEVYAWSKEIQLKEMVKGINKLTTYQDENTSQQSCIIHALVHSGYTKYIEKDNSFVYVKNQNNIHAKEMIVVSFDEKNISIYQYSGNINLQLFNQRTPPE